MPITLRDLLNSYREGSRSEREKGTYFERLTKAWLEVAPTQSDQFLRVLTFSDWAAERREDRRDVGIDLCAQLADDPDTWCAIQCKFYDVNYKIQKSDLDTFFTAKFHAHCSPNCTLYYSAVAGRSNQQSQVVYSGIA